MRGPLRGWVRPAVVMTAGMSALGWVGIAGQPAVAAHAANPSSILASGTGLGTAESAIATNPPRIAGLATDGSTFCAVLRTGTVDCWGENLWGELGRGPASPGTCGEVQCGTTAEPVLGVGGQGILSGVRRVSSDGNSSFCAVLTSGGVDCWGDNDNGALGMGTFSSLYSPVPEPVRVKGGGLLSGVKSVADHGPAGFGANEGFNYCALLTSGGVDCWGSGPLGNSSDQAQDVAGPVKARGGRSGFRPLSGAKALASNGLVACAVLTSGGLDCWGNPSDVGSNTDGRVAAPVIAVGGQGSLSGVRDVLTSTFVVCALLTSGGVDCWGNNDFGDGVGNPAAGQFVVTPVTVAGVGGNGTLSGAGKLAGDFVSSGTDLGTTCAGLTSGNVACWGADAIGQLGAGSLVSGQVPSNVVATSGGDALDGVSRLASSDFSFCGVLTSGGVDCWGLGGAGQLGNGMKHGTHCGSTCTSVPVGVVGLKGQGILSGVVNLVGARDTYCAVLGAGGVDCWGEGKLGERGNGTTNTADFPAAVKFPVG